MNIFVATGDDNYKIEQFIALNEQELDPCWAILNSHEFTSEELREAIECARTLSFNDSNKLIVVRGEIRGEQSEEISELLELNPPATTIIFVTNLDRRTKVGKIITSRAAIKQFHLIPQWKVQQLIQEVQTSSQKLGVKLPQQVAEYIVEAVGNDSARIAKELEKLAVCRGDRTITFKEVKKLIPSLNHSAIELAKAIKEHDALKINQLCLDLLAISEHPLKITATLLTLFRTWLRLKAAIDAGIKSDRELQSIALVSNPNRLYFLKQEVQNTSTHQLSKIIIKLFEIECELKQGLNPESLSSRFLLLLK